MEITAVFETVDWAECALVRLREAGIRHYGCKTRPVHPGADAYPEFVLPVTAGFVGTVASSNGATGYGFADMWVPAVLSRRDYRSVSNTREGVSGEVVMQISVSDEQGAAAQRALISNHGRRVRALPGFARAQISDTP